MNAIIGFLSGMFLIIILLTVISIIVIYSYKFIRYVIKTPIEQIKEDTNNFWS